VAIRIPIVSEWDGRGLAKARRDIKNAEGFLGKAGAAAKAFRGTLLLAGTAAAAAFAKISADAVMLASDLDETQNKLNEVFGDGAQSITKNLEKSAREIGQTRQQAYDAAATFGIFGKAAGLAGDDLVTFSEDLVRLSADFSSFYNTSPEDAITAIGAALRSEAEPIRRFGVLLDAATLKQRALAMGIAEGNKPLTQQQKILAASEEIFAQSADAIGDFDRTQGGLANSLRQNQALFKELQTYFGEGLYDGLMSSADGMDDVEGALESLGGTARSVGSGFGNLLRMLGTAANNFQRGIDEADSFGEALDNLFRGANQSRRALSGTVQAAIDAGNAMRGAAGDANALAAGLDEVTDSAPRPSSAFYSAFGQLRKTTESQQRRAIKDTTSAISGGTRAIEENAKATKRADEAVERYTKRVQLQVDRLELARDELRAVNEEAAAFADTATAFLKSGTAIADAIKLDEEGRAAAKEAGEDYAGTWYDAFQQALADRREAQKALDALAASLNPADSRGNELLMRELFALDPAEAEAIARELVQNGTGPAVAAQLSAYDLWAGEAGDKWAQQFYAEGIRGAEAQVDAITTTLENELGKFYAAGKRMGEAVMAGYNSVIGNLPVNVNVPGNTARSAGPTYSVTVNAGVGDPVAIARTIETTLRSKARRVGS
jgi:phage-related tail protein